MSDTAKDVDGRVKKKMLTNDYENTNEFSLYNSTRSIVL
jgi:hypothetical protein